MCALISRTYGPSTADPVATGSTVLAAHVNTDLDTLYSEINGNLDNVNIKSTAAIVASKLNLTSGTGNVYVKAGNVVRVYEAADVKYLSLSHNGTDSIISSSGGAIYGYLPAGTQSLGVLDGTGADSLTIYHDGTNGYISSSAGAIYASTPAGTQSFGVKSSGGKSLYMYHDDTNGVITTSAGEIQFGTSGAARNIRCWGTAYLDVGTAWTNFDIYDDIKLLKAIKSKNLKGLPALLVDKAKNAVSIQGMLCLLRDTLLFADEKIAKLENKVSLLEAKV